MKNIIELNGEWSLCHFDEGCGEKQKAFLPEKKFKNSMKAKVPGAVHADLIKEKLIPEPLFNMNVEKCQWVAEKEWWYKKEFEAPYLYSNKKTELVFEGLDTTSKIYLNGELVGETDNCLVPHTIDVTDKVIPGKNTLIVKLDAGMFGVKNKEMERYMGKGGHGGERIWIRKPQYVFGWDWAPKLVSCGIWRPVRVVSYEKAAVRDVFIKTKISGKSAVVTAEVELESFITESLRLTLYVFIGGKLEKVTVNAKKGTNKYKIIRKLGNPKLWWPRGAGEPNLYDFKLEVKDEGKLLDKFETRFGIREIKLVQETLPLPEGGKSFTLEINGKKVFCKGANWVPADCIFARITKEKYRNMVGIAAGANFNMFRVWGGGIYEDDEFYEACDESGIMVWQDFIYACAMYPDDDKEFYKAVKDETEKAVKRLRNHPGLVLWCGNNENNEAYDERWIGNKADKRRIFYGKKVYNEILPSACVKFDGTRPYRPGSPYGGEYANSDYEGDMHAWNVGLHGGPVGRIDYRNFENVRGRFISEYGLMSMPNYGSVKKYLPAKEMRPGSKAFNFHTNRMNWFGVPKTDRGFMARQIELFYGDPKILSFKEFVKASQLIQGEGYKFEIEHLRRRMYTCSGSLFWMYADAWGEMGWTILDYYLGKKLSYYHVKKAYQPLLISIKKEEYGVSIWVINDTLKSFSAELEYGIKNFTGEKGYLSFGMQAEKISRKKIIVGPNCSVKAAFDSLDVFKRDNFYYVKLKVNGKVVSENTYLAHALPNIKMPAAAVKYSVKTNVVRLETDNYAHQVVLELPAGVETEDNAFNILPGESKVIKLSGDARKFKNIEVSWYNYK